jgi:D-glycero-D-manno-heptose 1,7-bisphosphate phosphatase
MKKAAFLDRDGVINRKAPDGGYITRWEDFQILPGVSEAIALLNATGFQVIVASNQRGVAKGLYSIAALDEIHSQMRRALASGNARVDAVYYCPHDIFPPCTCRKPAPGMLLTAAIEHNIDLANSWMIGDSSTDVEAGKRAGCKSILLASRSDAAGLTPDFQMDSLLAAAKRVVADL